MRFLLIIAAAAIAIPAATSAREAVGFCNKYRQTESDAGSCDGCTLTVISSTTDMAYLIRANNGWSAGAGWDHGPDAAQGVGMWDEGAPDGFDLAVFDAFFSLKEDDGLEMIMTMRDPKVFPEPIVARYACAD